MNGNDDNKCNNICWDYS